MAILLDNVTNYVWQAFDVLQQDKSGFVNKSKLKVLTANIGTLLDLYGVERGLEHYRSTSTLNFDQYRYYLQKEVFSSLPNKLQLSELHDYETRIAEVCWLVCRKRFLNQPQLQQQQQHIFNDDSIYKIFRIFCVLGELIKDNNNDNLYNVLLHPNEAGLIAENLAKSLGCRFDDDDFTNLSISIGNYRLASFIAILETRSLIGVVKDENAISEAVTDIYQTIVEDVIKKGYLSKKGYIFPTMREFWFVLKPSELSYYKTSSERDRCGFLTIPPGSRIEPKTDYKIILHTPERSFELATNDHMTRLQWISALQLAIDYSDSNQTYQRLQAMKRRQQRAGRLQEMIHARLQLQQERNARQLAEGQAKELEAVVREDTRKLSELEELRVKLERLLVEETQAKRDEEIVRALQARVLAEEWEKREELERLQEEQRQLLEEERGKRLEFEQRQKEKEQELKNAQERLQQLEKERQILDGQLKVAHDKIKVSEEKKEVLEARLYQVVPSYRDGDRVRRAHSFMPSTKERPVLLEVRAATLRRPSKH